MKVALVYDRVNKWGGAERVLLALHEIFPKAPLYTSLYDSQKAEWVKKVFKVIPSFVNKIPYIRDKHELLSIFMPVIFEQFDFSEYDLVISITSEAAKGVITKPSTRHISYCLTPTRYLWGGNEFYRKNPQGLLKIIPFFNLVSKPFMTYVRYWDEIAAQRPDRMVAISNEVKRRIKKYYHRDSIILYPPVDVEKFQLKGRKAKGDYFLVVSRLVPYKRVDLVIKAFNKLKFPLIIIGMGKEEKYLKRIAGKNISFAGFVSDKDLINYYARAKAFIHPQNEDFGISAIEAQAAGVPVIAYGKGGAMETVIEGRTGIFFKEQTVDSLVDAVKRFGKMNLDTQNLIENARKFSKERFKKEFRKLI